MEHPINDELTPPTPKALKSRRELLKVLTATGGAVTASALLSGQWMKPVVEVGLLPAHAQTSSSLTASNASTTQCWAEGVNATMSPPVSGVQIEMTYHILTNNGDPVRVFSPESTNAAGVADFGDVGLDNNVFELQFRFVDQATYGPATATLGPLGPMGAC